MKALAALSVALAAAVCVFVLSGSAVRGVHAQQQFARSCPLLTFDQSVDTSNGVRFRFTPTSQPAPEWVEVHYGITAPNAFNFKMIRSGNAWEHADQSLRLGSGDALRYWFTYYAVGQQCDSDHFTAGATAGNAALMGGGMPFRAMNVQALSSGNGYGSAASVAPLMQQQPMPLMSHPIMTAAPPQAHGGGTCPAVQFRQSATAIGQGVRFTFESADSSPLTRVELHYGLAGQPTNSVNLRMKAISPSQWEWTDVSIAQSAGMKYWFSYDTGSIACDTDMFMFGGGAASPQALMQQPVFIPVVQPLQSGGGYGQQQQAPQALQHFATLSTPPAAAGVPVRGGSTMCPATQFRHSAQATAQGVRFAFESLDNTLLQRVDVHYGLTGQPTNAVNTRMKAIGGGGSQWEFIDTSIRAEQLNGLKYWFTYSTGPVDCDTDVFTAGNGAVSAATAPLRALPLASPSAYGQQQMQPQPLMAALPPQPRFGGGTCPAIAFRQSATAIGQGVRFTFESADGSPLTRVELHYGLAGQPTNSVNLRMKAISPSQWETVETAIAQPAGLKHWFSYDTGSVACDTDVFTFGGAAEQAVPQALMQHFIPVVQPLQSGYGQQQQQPQALTATPQLTAGGGSCPAITFEQKLVPTGNGLRWQFRATDGTALRNVDLHFGLNDQPKNAVNVKMRSQTPTVWTHHDNSIAVTATDRVTYWFTYFTATVNCDTDVFTFGGGAPAAPAQPLMAAPQPIVQPIMAAPAYGAPAVAPLQVAPLQAGGGSCPSLQFQQSVSNGQFSFAGLNGVAQWVDVHWGMSGQPINSMNVRMKSSDGGKTWIHADPSLAAAAGGNGMRWYFTYNANGVDCDTEQFGGSAPTPQALTAAPAYGPAPAAPQPVMAAPLQSYAPAPVPAPQPLMGAPQPIMAAPAPAYGAPQALSSSPRLCPSLQFQQSIANGQFTFTALSGVASWVDVHWGTAGQAITSMNVRMKSADGGKTWTHADPSLASTAGNGLRYYFTYNANGVDCDTEQFGAAAPAPQALTAAPAYGAPAPAPAPAPLMAAPQPIMAAPSYAAPAPQPIMAAPTYAPAPQPILAVPAPAYGAPQALAAITCPSLQFQQSIANGQFSFAGLNGVAQWVDVHWGVSGQPINSMNVRMKSSDGGKTWIHSDPSLAAGAGGLRYYFTYNANGVDCDTEIFGAATPQALAAAPSYAPAPQPIMAAPSYAAPAPAPAPASAPQPIMAAPSYAAPAPAPQPIMAAPAYAAPQPLAAAPAYSAPAPAPQALAAATAYSAPAPQALQGYSSGPQPIRAGPMCPFIQFQQSVTPGAGGLQFSFVSLGGAAAFVDVHYGISGQPPTAVNARMKSSDGGKSWTHTDATALLGAGGSVRYFFTYCVDHVDCDTEVFHFGMPPPQPIMAQPIMAAPSYGAPAPQPVMVAPSYSAPAPAPQPLAAPAYAAPAYSAPTPQPVMAAPSYATAPQPLQAPAYSAPQPLQAPAYAAPYTAPIHSTMAQMVRTVPLETPPAYAPAPQPLAAASSYSAPAPQPLAAAPSYGAPAPAPTPALPIAPAPQAFAALPVATAAPLMGSGFGHGHGFGGGFGGFGGGHLCPITGRPLAFPPPVAPIGGGFGGGFGAGAPPIAFPIAPIAPVAGVGALGAAPFGAGAGPIGAAPLLGGGPGFGAGGFGGAGFGAQGFGAPGIGGGGFDAGLGGGF